MSQGPRSAVGRVVVAVLVAGLIATTVGVLAYVVRRDSATPPPADPRDPADPAAAGVTVAWAGTEERPACLAHGGSVTVRLTISGRTNALTAVQIRVTAYADENTSRPVGSTTRTVHVDGPVERSLTLAFDVRRAPHVDEDGVAACTLATSSRPSRS